MLRMQMSMSSDGYVAGPDQSVDNPLGEGGMQLHEWAFNLATWRSEHGLEGGEENPSTAISERMFENTGAVIMGRNMFGGGPGPWPEPAWDGWWGPEPPYHVPVYVLTHHPRAPLTLSDTTFHFVTDGPEAALVAARAAAGGRNVLIGGGAQTARHYLEAGQVDEMILTISPVTLGAGERLFDSPKAGEASGLVCVETIDAPGVTHLVYQRDA